MFSLDFTKIEVVYQVTTFLLSIGIIILTLEELCVWPVFQSNGLLSWKVSRLIDKWYARGWVSRVLNCFLNDRSFLFSLYLRLVVSFALLITSFLGIISPILLSLDLVLLALVAIRSPYGLDGSYQMFLMVLLGLSLGSCLGTSSPQGIFCIWFIAAQLTLSYFISGIVKLFSPFWRKGYALNMVFGTKIYGHALMYRVITMNTAICCALCWTVIAFETLFFSVFLVDPQYVFFFLGAGFLFHLANAVFMGLNSFFWAFLSAYPALLYFVLQKQFFPFFQ